MVNMSRMSNTMIKELEFSKEELEELERAKKMPIKSSEIQKSESASQ